MSKIKVDSEKTRKNKFRKDKLRLANSDTSIEAKISKKYVEYLIEYCICKFLFDSDNDKNNLFSDIILNTKEHTFTNYWENTIQLTSCIFIEKNFEEFLQNNVFLNEEFWYNYFNHWFNLKQSHPNKQINLRFSIVKTGQFDPQIDVVNFNLHDFNKFIPELSKLNDENSNCLALKISQRIKSSLESANEQQVIDLFMQFRERVRFECEENAELEFYQARNVQKLALRIGAESDTLDAKSAYSLLKFKLKEAFVHKKENVSLKEILGQINNDLVHDDLHVKFANQIAITEAMLEKFNSFLENTPIVIKRKSLLLKINKEFSRFLLGKHLFFLVYGPKSSGKLFTALNLINERVKILSLMPGQMLFFNSSNIKCLFDLIKVKSIQLFVITEIESIFDLLSKQELNMLTKMIRNSKRKFMLIISNQTQKKLVQKLKYMSALFKVDWLSTREINSSFNEQNIAKFCLDFDRRVFNVNAMSSDLYAILKKPKYLCEILSQNAPTPVKLLPQDNQIEFELIKQTPLYSFSSILFDIKSICCLLDCGGLSIEKVKHVLQTLDTFKSIDLSSFLGKLFNYDSVILKQPTLIVVESNETESLNRFVLKKLNVQSKVVFVGNGVSDKMDFFDYSFNLKDVLLESDLIVQSATRLNGILPISFDANSSTRLDQKNIFEHFCQISYPLIIERKRELNNSFMQKVNVQYLKFDGHFVILCVLDSQILYENVFHLNLNDLVLAHYENRSGKLKEWQTELVNKCLRNQSLILVLNDFDVNLITNNHAWDLVLKYPKLVLMTEKASKTYLRKLAIFDLIKLELNMSDCFLANENSFVQQRHQLFSCTTELLSNLQNDSFWLELIRQFTVYEVFVLIRLSWSTTICKENILNSNLFVKYRRELENIQFISFGILILNTNKFKEDFIDPVGNLNIVKQSNNEANETLYEFDNQALQDYFCSIFIVNELNKTTNSKWSNEIKDFLERKRHYKKFHSVILLLAELLSFQNSCLINDKSKLDESLRFFWAHLLKKTKQDMISTAHQELIVNCLKSSNLNNEFFKNVRQTLHQMFAINTKREHVHCQERNAPASLDEIIRSIENFLFNHGYQRAPVHLNNLKLLINCLSNLINENTSRKERESCFEFLKTQIETNEPTRMILKSHLIEEYLINVLVKLACGFSRLNQSISDLMRKHFLNSYQTRTQFKASIALIKLGCIIDRTMFSILFETVKRKDSLTLSNESNEALEYLKNGRIDQNDPQLVQTIATCLKTEHDSEMIRTLLKLVQHNMETIDWRQMPEMCHAYYYFFMFEQGNANTFNVNLLLDHIVNLRLYDLVDHVPSLLKFIGCKLEPELLRKCLSFITFQSDAKYLILIEQICDMKLVNESYLKNYLIDSFINRTQTIELISLCLKYNLINEQALATIKNSFVQRVYANANLDVKWLLNEYLPNLAVLRDFLVDSELAESLKYLIRNFLQNGLILNGIKNCLIKMAKYGFELTNHATNICETRRMSSYEQFLNILCLMLNQSVKLQKGSSFKKNFLMKRVSEDLLEFMNNVLCLLDLKPFLVCLFNLYTNTVNKINVDAKNDETRKLSQSLDNSFNDGKFYMQLLECKCKLDSIAIVFDQSRKSEIQFVQNDLIHVHNIQYDWIFDDLIGNLAYMANELNVNKNLIYLKLNDEFYIDFE